MKVLKSQAYILCKVPSEDIMSHLELAGRVCYKSENAITTESSDKFIRGIISRGHESVIEHISVSALVICDRSVSHQIVRHRIASYSQESQRYCNYGKDKFDNEVRFILPTWLEDEGLGSPATQIWMKSMEQAEQDYKALLKLGWAPEQARVVLPNSTKTELYMTMNLREWRHFLKVRTDRAAGPQIRNIANQLLSDLVSYLPAVFKDLV